MTCVLLAKTALGSTSGSFPPAKKVRKKNYLFSSRSNDNRINPDASCWKILFPKSSKRKDSGKEGEREEEQDGARQLEKEGKREGGRERGRLSTKFTVKG